MRTIKKRNYYYRIARKHGRSEDYDRYKCQRNDVVSVLTVLKLGKVTFFNTLNPNLSKNFWTAIRYVKKKQCSIPTLVSNKCNFESDEEKAIITSPEILTVPYHH